MSEKNKPSVLLAWTMYDWANSVYSLSISSAIFPIFYEKFSPKTVEFMGNNIAASVLYEYTLALSFLAVAAVAPLLSGIADFGGLKKPFMRFFVVLGSLACSSMYFYTGGNVLFGLGCFFFATVGFAGSLVFYNSYLPDIATSDRFDKLSARGFTMGYIGSVLMLILNLLFLQKPEWFGMDPPSATNTFPFQSGFLIVGIWWLGWSFWPLFVLPKIKGKSESKVTRKVMLNGYKEINAVFKKVRGMKPLLIFLASFFVYTMGVQTIIYVAGLFGSKELELEPGSLLITILLIQLIGIAGAYFFAWLADKKGNKFSLGLSLAVWALVCVFAFFVEKKQPMQFFALACLVGTVMGGVQSLSRATYAKLIPGDVDNTSYFSFYEVTEKMAIVLGTLSFGLIDHLTGSMRNSILLLMSFFIIGLIILSFLHSDKLRPSNVKRKTSKG